MPGKLRSRWEGPFKVKEMKPYGVVELFDPKSEATFKVNGHRVKKYHGYKLPKELEVFLLADALRKEKLKRLTVQLKDVKEKCLVGVTPPW